ncbi:MAG: mevalonate kinase [Legionellales bacterium]|nr:mevalonate kinase [Legionellales bacterium]
MSSDFNTAVHGKWILAGEHAVIRGHSALVFPITSKSLTLSYQNSSKELSASYSGESGADTHLLFWSVLEQGMQLQTRSLNQLSGHFDLYSDVPIGVGMGASAALCVATARWFATQITEKSLDIHEFAKRLEDLFHGQSSGLDIAGVAATSGVHFLQGRCTPLTIAWTPQWFLSSCGQIGITSHCIDLVKALWEKDPTFATSIDQHMSYCVQKAQNALEKQTATSLPELADAINSAKDCFQQWGLVSDGLQKHMDSLREAGAIAVKPTGSGGGGYVISLWATKPPEMDIELMAI